MPLRRMLWHFGCRRLLPVRAVAAEAVGCGMSAARRVGMAAWRGCDVSGWGESLCLALGLWFELVEWDRGGFHWGPPVGVGARGVRRLHRAGWLALVRDACDGSGERRSSPPERVARTRTWGWITGWVLAERMRLALLR